MSRNVLAVGALAATIASAASANVVVLTGENVFDLFAASAGVATVTETFDAFNGFYNDPLAGSTGSVNWTASAPGGLFASAGMMSTNNSTYFEFDLRLMIPLDSYSCFHMRHRVKNSLTTICSLHFDTFYYYALIYFSLLLVG